MSIFDFRFLLLKKKKKVCFKFWTSFVCKFLFENHKKKSVLIKLYQTFVSYYSTILFSNLEAVGLGKTSVFSDVL